MLALVVLRFKRTDERCRYLVLHCQTLHFLLLHLVIEFNNCFPYLVGIHIVGDFRYCHFKGRITVSVSTCNLVPHVNNSCRSQRIGIVLLPTVYKTIRPLLVHIVLSTSYSRKTHVNRHTQRTSCKCRSTFCAYKRFLTNTTAILHVVVLVFHCLLVKSSHWYIPTEH